ncbi:hypothetical protein ABIB73_004693 [Bradyrhizobium sp. F1.4.3]|uniref:hypothetical protein n=1 Tax=Bradyrhizobium sp. F1.4.3 TaxID=3156356 RepID=UPI00339A0E9A
MDRTPLQYLVSGRDQSGYVSLGRTTTAAALKKAKELLQEGYIDVRICTPQGRILESDEFDEFEA